MSRFGEHCLTWPVLQAVQHHWVNIKPFPFYLLHILCLSALCLLTTTGIQTTSVSSPFQCNSLTAVEGGTLAHLLRAATWFFQSQSDSITQSHPILSLIPFFPWHFRINILLMWPKGACELIPTNLLLPPNSLLPLPSLQAECHCRRRCSSLLWAALSSCNFMLIYTII